MPKKYEIRINFVIKITTEYNKYSFTYLFSTSQVVAKFKKYKNILPSLIMQTTAKSFLYNTKQTTMNRISYFQPKLLISTQLVIERTTDFFKLEI